jgi:hypothetical protein
MVLTTIATKRIEKSPALGSEYKENKVAARIDVFNVGERAPFFELEGYIAAIHFLMENLD